jgi:hypothetical protein
LALSWELAKMMTSKRLTGVLGTTLIMSALLAGAASAATVSVTIRNNQPDVGLYLTPLFVAFHDGSYDAFNAGETASAGVTLIAEEGDVSVEIANAQSQGAKTGVITSPGGFAGAPVIDPGETATFQIDLDRLNDRFFTFLSMVIPSNDNFIGNDNPFAFEIFDVLGKFTNLGPISILGGNVWDAGTEVNNNIGAAFNASGGSGTDENGLISLQANLDFLLGSLTADGTTVSFVPGARDVLATIELALISPVPVPASLPILATGLGLFGLLKRRRRQR